MATLTGNSIASTYTGLLSVSGAVGADTVEAVTDGAGTSTSLSLSQQRATITLGSGAGDDFIVDGTTLVVEGDTNRVGIGTASPGSELDLAGGYMANEQGRQNHVANTMPAPYYRLDGVNDYIDLNSHISAFDDLKENASTSVLFRYIADGELISHGWGDKWTTSVSSGKALLNWRTSDESESVFGSTDLVVGNIYCIVGTYDGANLKVYLSGVLDGTEAMTGDILNRASSDFYLGRRQAVYNESEIYAVQFWNKALTATEVKELYSGASVPFKYKGANQTNLWDTPASVFTSGTYAWTATGSNTIANVGNALAVTYESATDGAYVYFRAAHDLSTNMIVGARYRFSVDAKYAGGSACSLKVHNGSSAEPTQTLTTSTVRYEFEFTSGHATNGFATFSGMNAGNVVTIDNLSIVRIGAVAEYDGSGASEEHWFDTSGNDLHGDVTGATLNNQGDGGATKAITLTPRALPSTANASEGQIVYDSSANKLKVYNGSAWETITSS